MLVHELGPKAKFCGLLHGQCGLGLGLRGLALAKVLRPLSWQTHL